MQKVTDTALVNGTKMLKFPCSNDTQVDSNLLSYTEVTKCKHFDEMSGLLRIAKL